MDYTDEFDFCRSYLESGEYILWKGKPGKGSLLTARDIVVIPFSLIWLAFALFWEVTVIKQSFSIFAMVWGLPFILVGLYLLVGRFLYAVYLRKKTCYVVTNKKFILKQKNKIEWHDGKTYQLITLKTHKNGGATMVFGQSSRVAGYEMPHAFFTFDNLSNPEEVLNAIRNMEQEQRQPADF